jgi:hypothetical protein
MPIAQIEDLSQRVVAYARHVEDMIEHCRASLFAWKPQALNDVVEKAEKRANEFEVELEEE